MEKLIEQLGNKLHEYYDLDEEPSDVQLEWLYEQTEPSNVLIIEGIGEEDTESSITDKLEPLGEVIDVKIIFNWKEDRTYAWILFDKIEIAQKAIELLIQEYPKVYHGKVYD